MPEAQSVNELFARIARRYDLANRGISAGGDTRLRRALVELARKHQPRSVADLATGSGDVAFALKCALGADAAVTGYDFCQPMLDRAVEKRDALADPFLDSIPFLQGDCLDLPIGNASVDMVTIAFGLRNLEDRAAGLREMHRVLRPGGALLILEFSQPKRWFRPVYYFYMRFVMPLIAGILTGDRKAYVYLHDSISAFPDREELAGMIRDAGFGEVRLHPKILGAVCIHEAIRDGPTPS